MLGNNQAIYQQNQLNSPACSIRIQKRNKSCEQQSVAVEKNDVSDNRDIIQYLTNNSHLYQNNHHNHDDHSQSNIANNNDNKQINV